MRARLGKHKKFKGDVVEPANLGETPQILPSRRRNTDFIPVEHHGSSDPKIGRQRAVAAKGVVDDVGHVHGRTMNAAKKIINETVSETMKVPPLGRTTMTSETVEYKHQIRVEFAQRLIRVREALGKTRQDWMREYDLGYSQISQWESAKSLPDLFILLRICEDNSVSIDYLLRGSQFHPNSKTRTKVNTAK